jgi:hypothetical protein
MDWIRFDKRLPANDTYVMVSNGPAMGRYHFLTDNFMDPNHQSSSVILWELSGCRMEVKVSEILQWCPLLPSERRPVKVKPLSWRSQTKLIAKTVWKRLKIWMGL